MELNKVFVHHLVKFSKQPKPSGFPLEVLTTRHNLDSPIVQNEVNRPGMSLFGFYDFFAHERVQIFGRGEAAFLKKVIDKKEHEILQKFFSYKIPAIFFSHGHKPDSIFLDTAESKQVPVFVTSLPTAKLTSKIYDFFDQSIFIKEVIHGVMMEVYGSGVLIKGPTGIGKSECALELIERGHRFIADDIVNIKKLKNNTLLAYPSSLLSKNMEIKGIGVIDISQLFGVRSVLSDKGIDFIINLEEFQSEKEYDLTGMEEHKSTFLEIDVPVVLIPVRQGSNLPILIETATMNERLKQSGHHAAKEFNRRLMNRVAGNRRKENDGTAIL